jgi:Big-like domain-containing protein
VSSSANPSTTGQNVTLTATVTAPAGLSGSVSFYDGSTLIGTVALSGATAQLTIASLAGGGHAITARYLGNATIPPSTSPAFAQYVQPAGASTRTVTAALAASPSPATLGSTVTLTATVTGSQNKAPGGIVSFMLNGSVLGQATLIQTGKTTAAVSLAASSLPHGTHKVEAVYLGDATFRAGRTSISLVVQ